MSSPTSLLRKAYRKVRPRVQQSPPDLDRIFFLHLPKCGGTSVDKALRDIYRSAGLHTEHLNAQASARASDISGKGLRKFRRAILLYHLAQKNTHYLSGHFSYNEQARKSFEDWRYVTVLREPVARWLSGYFYNKYKAGSDHFGISDSIEAYLDTRQALVAGRLYVTQLTDDVSIDEAGSEEAIGQSIDNLDAFAVVGVLERLDVFIRDCESAFRIHLPIEHHRQGPRTSDQQRDEVSDEILERVRELCAPNLRVYDAVRARIDTRGTWLDTVDESQ